MRNKELTLQYFRHTRYACCKKTCVFRCQLLFSLRAFNCIRELLLCRVKRKKECERSRMSEHLTSFNRKKLFENRNWQAKHDFVCMKTETSFDNSVTEYCMDENEREKKDLLSNSAKSGMTRRKKSHWCVFLPEWIWWVRSFGPQPQTIPNVRVWARPIFGPKRVERRPPLEPIEPNSAYGSNSDP